MYSTLSKWLSELDNEIDLIYSSDLNEEAQSNMVAFGVNKELLKTWSERSLIAFISECSEIYKRKNHSEALVFYSWFDELAGQLRVSAVRENHKEMPFSCKLNRTTLERVVKGILMSDSGVYTNGALDVWCQNI